MRRATADLAGIILCLTMAACDSSTEPDPPGGSPPVAITLDAPPATLALGAEVATGLTARLEDGRTVRWTSPYTLEVVSQARTYDALDVVALRATAIAARGPGTAQIIARVGTISSDPITITVPAGTPILAAVEPAAVPSEGGVVAIHGYDLDGVGDVLLDGVATTPLTRSATRLDVTVHAAPGGCRGRSATSIAVAGAYVVPGVLSVRRPRPNEMQLAVAEMRLLGAATDLCVPLAAIPGAEYVIGYFDTRGIESARTGAERTDLPGISTRIVVADASATSAVAPSSAAPASAPLSVGPRSAPPVDIVRVPATAALEATPADYYENRATPWSIGDGVSIRNDATGGYLHGTIFHSTPHFAIATLDRDAVYDIPRRLDGVVSALGSFETHVAPILRATFVDEWPATTEGSGQMLIIVGDWPYAGFLAIGGGLVDRGTWIGIDPAVVEIPATQSLNFADNVLFHEMTHAYQDRFLMRQCTDQHDCLYDFWGNTWAVEGGAELMTEYAMATTMGFAFDGNAPFDGPILNVFGFIFYYGPDTPHYIFSSGYGSASWLMRDFVHRAVRRGTPRATAFREVARGSVEGWFGNRPGGGGTRLGLQRRLASLLGTFDPADASVVAVLSVGADDLTADPALQVPFVQSFQKRFVAARTMRLGDGTGTDVTYTGTTFAYWKLQDGDGLGGTVTATSGIAPLAWGIVRVK